MIELKAINNSHVTLETLKAFNEWLADIYNCRIGFIDSIMCYKQYAAETSWANTTVSMQSVLNNIPIDKHRLLLQYLRNNYHREMSIGDVSSAIAGTDVYHQSSCMINLRTNQLIGVESSTTNVPTEVKASHGEIRIPIPEGYDGNTAYVELNVPYEVIHAMLFREIGAAAHWVIDANLTHPLAVTANDFGNASSYGWVRPHALLFYQRYTKKSTGGRNTLKIDVAKSKAWVSIMTHSDLFTGPFSISNADADTIEPLVEVKIVAYKFGAT